MNRHFVIGLGLGMGLLLGYRLIRPLNGILPPITLHPLLRFLLSPFRPLV